MAKKYSDFNFAEILRDHRNSTGKKQLEVAHYLKMKLSTYQSYEENRAVPRIETIIKLAAYYQVTIDSFLYQLPAILR